ncbi:transcriptional regulator [Diplodia corticola]|uniref:Transcriptional regulator n=1 Tax=Diplodia corticola TaxID=236234 RepID=A0A1J9S2L6_9PEZI|nr:transcriptional regulator [Diplodia corticola]OJD33885.1 transcriptional regulator [Diplodia corticola]
MYLRAAHAEHHLPTLRAFIRANPLGIFTTALASPTQAFPLLQSSHLPFLLDVLDDASETELGTLRAHIARANPQSKAMIEAVTSSSPSASTSPATTGGPRTLEQDVLILFNAPAHHYVTPKFYAATKPATGKVVPTWDYAAVQVYGRARLYFDNADPATDAYLARQVAELSRMAETRVMGYERPWEVSDAPAPYVEALKKAIVGVEVEVTSMAGKWKMSQEMGEGDREGVVRGFEALGSELGSEMARVVREREELMVRRKAEGKEQA